MFKAEIDNVIFVVQVDSRKLDDTTRQAHVFLFSEFSIIEHLNYNNVVLQIDTFDNRRHLPITEQNRTAHMHRLDQLRVRASNSFISGKEIVICC